MVKVSIVVPIYNSEKHLKKCLDSLVNQTLKETEILLVDDGSTDGSREIMEQYRAQYPRQIRCIYQPNQGQACARNKGMGYAQGEYIAFVDSDDYLECHAYEKAYARAKQQDDDIVCFGFYQVEGDEKKRGEYTVFFHEQKQIRYILNETSPWNKLIKRSLLEEHSLRFTEHRIYEDLELIPQLSLFTSKIAFMDDCLYNYVIHSGSTMRQKVYNEKLASIYDVMQTLKDKFWDTKYRNELEYLYIEHLLHGAVLRYLNYPEGKKDIQKISRIMKQTFPKWYQNEYYKKREIKYQIVCMLAYAKQVFLLKKILKVK